MPIVLNITQTFISEESEKLMLKDGNKSFQYLLMLHILYQ